MKVFLSVLFVCLLQIAQAQQVENTSTLSIEQIMQGEKFVGYLPERIRWSEDSQWIYFSWNPKGDTLRSTYKVAAEGGLPQEMTFEEEKNIISYRAKNKANTLALYTKQGDLFLKDLQKNIVTQITNTADREYAPAFSADERKVIFKKGQNYYTWEIESGQLTQLTIFKEGKARKAQDPTRTEQDEWLYNDQIEWMEVLAERKATREARERRNELFDEDPTRKAIYYGNKRLSSTQISPTLDYVTYRLTQRVDPERTSVPYFVTESGYTENKDARAKVGHPQDEFEQWIYDVKRDTAYQIDITSLEGIYDKPAFLEAYHKGEEAYENQYEDPRSVICHGPTFAENGNAVLDIKAMDNKDRWIVSVDMATGQLTTLDRQHDDAWVGGPGVSSWNFASGNIGWLPDNETIYFQSERTGYSQLYCINVNKGKAKALTKGKFEILSAFLSDDKSKFYIKSNAESPHQQHLYTMPVDGGKMTKITDKAGRYDVEISPDESNLAIRYSYSNQPWELFVMKNEAGAELKQITRSTTEAFKSYEWRAPEIIYFDAADGAKVPARIYKPSAGKENKAAVIFVHGAGYLQNVHQWWSSYYREFMFHNILADNGYTVLDIDYRASSGYGRDWRTAIYQHMGGKDLSDQVDGAKYLIEAHGIDKEGIGIYGGSYGGFITLMAQFTEPGVFKSGAALRSVTDWAHYNHPYTSNILNTPVEDSLAYFKSSPIYHAEGLQDHLLILHGMVDMNVQFQDVVRLSQRLIELGKDNWELAVFPMERHGFVESSSWADEYKRIFKLFQETLVD